MNSERLNDYRSTLLTLSEEKTRIEKEIRELSISLQYEVVDLKHGDTIEITFPPKSTKLRENGRINSKKHTSPRIVRGTVLGVSMHNNIQKFLKFGNVEDLVYTVYYVDEEGVYRQYLRRDEVVVRKIDIRKTLMDD